MYKGERAEYAALNIQKLALLVLVFVGLSSGCARVVLMPTPNLYIRAEEDPFAEVSPALRTNRVEVIYGTDRRPIDQEAESVEYGSERSMSLAVGVSVAELGEDVSWEALAEASRVRRRRKRIGLTVIETREIGRYPSTMERITVVNGEMVDDPEAIAAEARIEKSLHEAIAERLAATDHKDAYVFIHGYNTTFDFALLTIAQLWHFLGREGVPVLYSWPAGRGGLLRGYTADRESGEFTIFHLKQFLRALASCPDLERIHIIAHSRGTDVTITALRELNIESEVAGRGSGTLPKLGNLILAAPDLDFEVTTQRIGAERLFDVADRFTIYLSPEDKAIWISTWLFDSVRRLGRLLPSDLSPKQKELAPKLTRLQLIESLVRNAGLTGHSYFYTNPAVSSDLVLILRYDKDPGEENGRPLIERSYNFWEIHDGYPN
jgi:esterase/lipase superfamily enzyme